MRILGIDPGLLHTGWAIIDSNGPERHYIASGVILPPVKPSLSERLAFVFRGVTELCDTFKPDVCSIEYTFVNKNPKTTLILGHPKTADESDAIAIAMTHANTNSLVYKFK